MTKKELSDYFKIDRNVFRSIVRRAAKDMDSIAYKLKKYPDTAINSVDFTLEECLCIISQFGKPLSKIQHDMFLENFISRDEECVSTKKKESLFIDGMEDFLSKKSPYIKCCETCAYLFGKITHGGGTVIRPYCNFYNMMLGYHNKINIFKDYCKSYKFISRRPLIWYKTSAPKNLNANGEIVSTEKGFSD